MKLFEKLFNKDNNKISQEQELVAPVSGNVVKLSEVPDPTFSQEILGKGIAIYPQDNNFFAPCDGIVENIFDTYHAISIKSSNGCEILIHIGLETVELGGKYYKSNVKNGQKIKKGDKIISFDRQAILDAGYNIITPIVICNSDEFQINEIKVVGKVNSGEPVLSITKL